MPETFLIAEGDLPAAAASVIPRFGYPEGVREPVDVADLERGSLAEPDAGGHQEQRQRSPPL
ncbi:hypothetical protein [Nocardia xishanensis]